MHHSSKQRLLWKPLQRNLQVLASPLRVHRWTVRNAATFLHPMSPRQGWSSEGDRYRTFVALGLSRRNDITPLYREHTRTSPATVIHEFMIYLGRSSFIQRVWNTSTCYFHGTVTQGVEILLTELEYN